MDIERLQQLGTEWEQGLASSTPAIGQVQRKAKGQRRKQLVGRSAVVMVPMLIAAGAFVAVSDNGAGNTETNVASGGPVSAETPRPAAAGPPPEPEITPQPPAPCDVQDPEQSSLFINHIQYLALDGAAGPTTDVVDGQLVINTKAGSSEVTVRWPANDSASPSGPDTGPYVFATKSGENDHVYVVPPGEVVFPRALEVAAALNGSIETLPTDGTSDLLLPQLVVDNESLVPELEKLDPLCGVIELTAIIGGEEVGPLTYRIGDIRFDESEEVRDTETGPLVSGSVSSETIPTEIVLCNEPGYDRIEEDILPDYFPDPETALAEFVTPVLGGEGPHWGTSGYTEMKGSDDLSAYVVPLGDDVVPAAAYVRIIVVEQTSEGWTVTSAKATGC